MSVVQCFPIRCSFKHDVNKNREFLVIQKQFFVSTLIAEIRRQKADSG